jgi:3-oxoacyl-ACP reductase-like protein
MSIFSKIFDKIFHRADAAQAPAGSASTAANDGIAAGKAATESAAAAAPATPAQPVDVEAVLTAMAEKNPQKLNWRTSIVDLMKLVGMESTLQERKELATELGYTGAKDGSAEMNMWLHKQVMKTLAENGGTVPAERLD